MRQKRSVLVQTPKIFLRYTPVTADVTQLLARWREGDEAALRELMPLVYDELRLLARRYAGQERGNHTLQGTALVHEAYMRLVDYNRIDWKGRAHYLGIAATVIRNILVDHARRRQRQKRGGDACFLQLDETLVPAPERDLDLVAVDDALISLAKLDGQQAKVVEMRFFAGLTIEETAEAMGISDSTVKRDWIVAKTWLFKEIQRGGGAVT